MGHSNGQGWKILNYKHGFIDKTGNELSFVIQKCVKFSDGLIAVNLNDKWFYR
jgi:hypothetical protein